MKKTSGPGAIHHLMIAVLSQHPQGLWHGEMRATLQAAPYLMRLDAQSHLGRRMRELPLWWPIRKTMVGNRTRYALATPGDAYSVIGVQSTGVGAQPDGPQPIHRQLIGILKQNPTGLTSGEMRALLQGPPFLYTPAQQTQVDRRMRELPYWYSITKVQVGTMVRYRV